MQGAEVVGIVVHSFGDWRLRSSQLHNWRSNMPRHCIRAVGVEARAGAEIV